MKIIFDKDELLGGLYPVMSTVSNQKTVASIEGVLIETMGEGNLVRLSTFDMNKGTRVVVEAKEIVESGSYIINAARLVQIIKVLGEEEITIAVDDSYNATISGGRASFSLSALRGEDFPALPVLDGSRGFELSAHVLKNMIQRVLHSVADQDARPMLCGAFFRIGDGQMEIVSCDSYSLSRRHVKCDLRDVGEVSVLDFSFIVPGHALNEMVRILPDDDTVVTVKIARKHAIFFYDRTIFFTRMIDSEYIDYERIIPKDQTIEVTVSRDALLSALERAFLIAEERIQGSAKNCVKIILEEDKMIVTSASVNGRVLDEIAVSHTGEDLEIGFNCRFLINSVRATEGENLRLTFKSATRGVTIHPAEEQKNGGFFYMVLPVRMNG